MTLRCEVRNPPAPEKQALIVDSIREVTKLRGEVEFVTRGALPSDGVLIEDQRDYS